MIINVHYHKNNYYSQKHFFKKKLKKFLSLIQLSKTTKNYSLKTNKLITLQQTTTQKTPQLKLNNT